MIDEVLRRSDSDMADSGQAIRVYCFSHIIERGKIKGKEECEIKREKERERGGGGKEKNCGRGCKLHEMGQINSETDGFVHRTVCGARVDAGHCHFVCSLTLAECQRVYLLSDY